jgi:DNA polymerase-4
LFQTALPLLEREADGRYFRLIGVGLSGLDSADSAPQADLFGEDNARTEALEKTVDDLRDRFGTAAPVKGRALGPKAK